MDSTLLDLHNSHTILSIIQLFLERNQTVNKQKNKQKCNSKTTERTIYVSISS